MRLYSIKNLKTGYYLQEIVTIYRGPLPSGVATKWGEDIVYMTHEQMSSYITRLTLHPTNLLELESCEILVSKVSYTLVKSTTTMKNTISRIQQKQVIEKLKGSL